MSPLVSPRSRKSATATPAPSAQTADAELLASWKSPEIVARAAELRHGLAALAWSLPQPLSHKESTALLNLATSGVTSAAQAKQIAKQLARWMSGEASNVHQAWEALLWARLLPTIASQQPADGIALYRQLVDLVESSPDGHAADDPLLFTWLGCELPLVLAMFSSHVAQQAAWQQKATASLARLREVCFDDKGLLPGRHMPIAFALLASLARCVKLSPQESSATLQQQFARSATAYVRYLPSAGDNPWTPTVGAPARQWLSDVENLITDDMERQLLKTALAGGGRKKQKDVEASIYSEDNKTAALRRDFAPTSPQLFVGFDGPEVRFELDVTRALLQGAWTSHLAIDGLTLTPEQDWEEVLWYTDEEVAYLELECWINDQWQVQRQMLVPKNDDFIFLADAVIGKSVANIEYRSGFGLAPGVTYQPEAESHEGWLTHKQDRWLALPLACPEWRVERSPYQFEMSGHQLTYSARRQGRSVYCPLFLSTAKSRGKRDYTWRRLTVAENLEIVPADAASASRVEVDALQWCFYRTLTSKGNRTFLGKNTSYEFFGGRFTRSGSFEPIMEVE